MFFHFGRRELWIAFGLCLLTAAIIGYKIFMLGYSMTTLQEEDGYLVRLVMEVQGNGAPTEVRVRLPIENGRQAIQHMRLNAPGFKQTVVPGYLVTWRTPKLEGAQTITCSFLAQTSSRRFPLPVGEAIPTTYPVAIQGDLAATDRIQSTDPAIRAKAYEVAPEGTKLKPALEAIFNECYHKIRYITVSGPTDAVTALRLGEASCNGKNRLLVALLRARGIPARLVNGLILQNSSKRTTHVWSEVWADGQWIPLCPTNGYLAELPESYLELAKEDVALISHTRHIGFDWKWRVRHQLKEREKAVVSNAENPLNVLHFWRSLKDYQVSLDLIVIILMVPIAATIVAFARNVIGLVPFGTFMPALLAVAFRDTGFFLGMALFGMVIAVGLGVNLLLLRLRLLHVPRLVIIMTIIVASMLAMSIACIKLGLANGAAVSLYPMAIMTLTCERFTQIVITESSKDAVKQLTVSFIVAALCFVVINWTFLQMLIVAFPELLLVNIALNLALGSWTGIRMLEYLRFRDIAGQPGAEA